MANKFDESEKERQEQKKMIEKLRGEVFSLNEKLNCITEQVLQVFWSMELPKKIRKTQML